jgi:hypothetical protein
LPVRSIVSVFHAPTKNTQKNRSSNLRQLFFDRNQLIVKVFFSQHLKACVKMNGTLTFRQAKTPQKAVGLYGNTHLLLQMKRRYYGKIANLRRLVQPSLTFPELISSNPETDDFSDGCGFIG